MELQRTLEGHGGCVNTVAFDPAGSLLVSGSDDMTIRVWDWEQGERAPSTAQQQRAGSHAEQARLCSG